MYLDAELRQALRLKAAHSRRSMSEIVNDALRQALREDQEDLAAVRSRANERTLDYEAFLAKLKADVRRILGRIEALRDDSRAPGCKRLVGSE